MLYLTLRLLHLMFMATWIGALLFLPGDVKRSLSASEAHLPLLRDRMGRTTKVATVSGLLTLGTGVGLIFALGGMGAVPPPIHIGLLTGLLMLGVAGGLVGRNVRKIDAGLEEGASPDTLLPAAKQMAMGTGIFHTLWLLTLVLMVFRNNLMG